MGLNTIIACHRHHVQTYMMRSEEGLDLQRWMRDHAVCFHARRVDIYRDCDNHPGYPEAWAYEDRPAASVRVTYTASAAHPLADGTGIEAQALSAPPKSSPTEPS